MRWKAIMVLGCILLVSSCGRSAVTPEAVIKGWADAVQAGDYAAVQQHMQTDATLFAAWQGRTEDLRQRQRLQNYMIDSIEAAGNSTTAMLRWTGATPTPMCATVQVSPDGVLTILRDLYDCEGTSG